MDAWLHLFHINAYEHFVLTTKDENIFSPEWSFSSALILVSSSLSVVKDDHLPIYHKLLTTDH